MNPEPDYSAAYVTIRTSEGQEGYGLAFTVGRGNDVQVAAVRTLAPLVVGLPLEDVLADLGGFSRLLTGDSQLRWLGPHKGVIHMAAAAIVNAMWDLYARRESKPVWRLLAEMSPEHLVNLVDFRYLEDALTRDEALDILRRAAPGRAQRQEHLLHKGYPAHTTTPGWLGYTDEKLVRLAKEAVADGFPLIKLKVGAHLDADVRRLRLARDAVGPDMGIALDANQAWGVNQAIRWLEPLALYRPYWIEEPTSPDDVLGHAAIRRAVAPIKVATGEHCHNQVMFKQLLQAGAIDILQMDASRVAGVTENVAILLLAAKYGVPVCPHAGGVRLCEMVQHLAMFDYVAVSGTSDGRMIEYVDHLHEHFGEPVIIRSGHYVAPIDPGIGARMYPQSSDVVRSPSILGPGQTALTVVELDRNISWLRTSGLGAQVNAILAGDLAPALRSRQVFIPGAAGGEPPMWTEAATRMSDEARAVAAVSQLAADGAAALRRLAPDAQVIYGAGGWTRSPGWMRLKAVAANVPYRVLAEPELTALGAAQLTLPGQAAPVPVQDNIPRHTGSAPRTRRMSR